MSDGLTPDCRPLSDELQLELERNRVVVQLAGAVAHKLKQPLAVAWGYLELLLEEPAPDLDPTTLRYLREVHAAVRTMDDVVNRLQRATVYQTRSYAGSLEIVDLDDFDQRVIHD